MTENDNRNVKIMVPEAEPKLKGRNLSWAELRRVDSLNLEAGRVTSSTPNSRTSNVDWGKTLCLTFQSIGVVYGDIGISPLYVFSIIFPDGFGSTDHTEDILGALSLVIYTIVLIPFLKYAFIVLWANDNGEGGTFALYSLLNRNAEISLIPNHQPEDIEISNYRLDPPSNQLRRASIIKKVLENNKVIQVIVLLVTILGTSMVIGDGILTPSISGAEAMFADLGHFNVQAIQISFSLVVLPSLVIAYSGQAAYLTKHPGDVTNAFYKSVPAPLYWPQNIVALLASIVASQIMISGTFSVISQSLSLGCFPKVKVIHTSAKYEGQVYIPEINYLLMTACVMVATVFKTPQNIANAYGITVAAVMFITTCMVTLIMLVIWKISIWWIALFFLIFGSVEAIFFSSVLHKFILGGYLPVGMAIVLMTVMATWHYVHQKRYLFELKHKVSSEFIRQIAENPAVNRVPGIGIFYSELVQGIPPIFPHFVVQIPSIHSVLVFVSIKKIPVTRVALEERFMFRQVGPREYRMFRCVVRYGYMDVMGETEVFEHQLVEHLKDFIRHEYYLAEGGAAIEPEIPQLSILLGNDGKTNGNIKSSVYAEESLQQQNNLSPVSSGSIQSFRAVKSNASSQIISAPLQGVDEEIQFLQKAKDEGVVYLLAEAEVVAEKKSSVFKKIIVNYLYSFIRRNFRQGETVLIIPHTRILRVGMTYEI
ncbi:hypothetical protein SLEP1_g9563 [Rubroshorea leprosula]|uniref:Potassium transporter n=1 Tax=Rubroshorea leprosula TaxID=152421 RepID=A0AAV5IF80_9ROSI|nr:hypothetical protein SLEP1_g9563 [Rubroshorea leprosula]